MVVYYENPPVFVQFHEPRAFLFLTSHFLLLKGQGEGGHVQLCRKKTLDNPPEVCYNI